MTMKEVFKEREWKSIWAPTTRYPKVLWR